jgi:NADH-quinone oxidoreductase subunit H
VFPIISSFFLFLTTFFYSYFFSNFCWFICFEIYQFQILNYIFYFFSLIVFLLILILSAAFLTVFERQVLGSIQHRKGPNVVGFLGLAQPIADAFKLLIKEPIIPLKSDIKLFLLSALFLLLFSLILWFILPLNFHTAILELNIAILYIFSISSLSIYGVIIAG